MMRPQLKVACIVPCRNEAGRVENVITAVSKSKIITEIIVVDDASTDGSADLIRANFPFVKLITDLSRLGKAGALKKGIESTDAETLLLLDADLTGLKSSHIDKSLNIFANENLDMLVVKLDIKSYFYSDFLKSDIVPSGQRIIKRSVLLGHLDNFDDLGYAIELYFNKLALENSWKIGFVLWEGLNHIFKRKKHGLFHETVENSFMLWQMFKNHSVIQYFSFYSRIKDNGFGNIS
ncbi:glycosyltransferase [candidate division WWE3 bacterium]|nr:glycosyltransferase [candidate division WWE3 bacterium]